MSKNSLNELTYTGEVDICAPREPFHCEETEKVTVPRLESSPPASREERFFFFFGAVVAFELDGEARPGTGKGTVVIFARKMLKSKTTII